MSHNDIKSLFSFLIIVLFIVLMYFFSTYLIRLLLSYIFNRPQVSFYLVDIAILLLIVKLFTYNRKKDRR